MHPQDISLSGTQFPYWQSITEWSKNHRCLPGNHHCCRFTNHGHIFSRVCSLLRQNSHLGSVVFNIIENKMILTLSHIVEGPVSVELINILPLLIIFMFTNSGFFVNRKQKEYFCAWQETVLQDKCLTQKSPAMAFLDYQSNNDSLRYKTIFFFVKQLQGKVFLKLTSDQFD